MRRSRHRAVPGRLQKVLRVLAVARMVWRAFRTYRRHRHRLRVAVVVAVATFVSALVRRRRSPALPAQTGEPTG